MKTDDIPRCYYEPKIVTKQRPLFEEQDDGNLIPYSEDE